MKNKVFKMTSLLLLLGILVFGVSAFAEDIKSRMIARLPAIKALKAKGIVGENNKGYLQFIGKNKEKEDVVNAENSDRKAVYSAIAKQQGTTVELVGKHRAIQIAKKAEAGEWLQDATGKWYKKK